MESYLVIFDCDGVLVDSEVIACRIEAEELTKIGFPVSLEEDIRLFAGKSHKTVAEIVERQMGRPLPEGFEDRLHAKIIRELSDALLPIRNVGNTLMQLTHKCVASSGVPEKIRNSLKVTGLKDYFTDDHIFSASMVEHGKPAPDLFLLAAKRIGFLPENCIVIEDSLAGVQAGVAAGMRTFGFVGGSHIIGQDHRKILYDAGAHLVFDDMAELAELVAAQ
jgi:HAD superfamily hydrolase (TIGR01509 family)